MHWLVGTLRRYPEIAIFLTLAMGFVIGNLKLGKISLGSVTGVLLAGVVIGQMDISISPNVKSVFFVMFLFAVGYGVGPQFFRGLKKDGLPQVLLAVIVCVACLGTALVVSRVLGYGPGQSAGLLSGACTISAVLGVATDSITSSKLSPETTQTALAAMPVAYAVTYLFGTAGSAWFLAILGPKLLGGDLVARCKQLEADMGADAAQEGAVAAYTRFIARAYRLADSSFIGKTVEEFEAHFGRLGAGKRVFIERIRKDGRIADDIKGLLLGKDDVVAVTGRREFLLEQQASLGPEVDDPELMAFRVAILDVVVTNRAFAGMTLKEIAESEQGSMVRGVFLRKILRADHDMPIAPGTKVDRGDMLQIVGSQKETDRVARLLGYADRFTDKTDVVFMGLGIGIGALIGAISVKIGSVPLSLSTSGGALIAGLVCGWLRAVNRTFGRIPGPALWVMNNIGLTAFIAVVGISAGPTFVAGLKSSGLSLFCGGVVVTCVPLLVGLLAGRFLFRFHPAITLGAVAGARTTTAALGAIQDVCRSNVAALGYTVPYAVGNTLLSIWGVVIVALMK